MAAPVTISCPKNTWTKIGDGVSTLDVWRSKGVSPYLMIYLPWRSAAPTTLDNASVVFSKSDNFTINSDRYVDVYIYPKRKDGEVIVYNNTGVSQNSTLFNRPLSQNGLPGGGVNLNVDGSGGSPVDFYIQALAGERLSITRFIVSIRSATNIGVNEYGDIATGLTNGFNVWFKDADGPLAGVKIDLLNPLTIKTNEDWGRWCYDSVPIPIGPTQNTQTWQARWTLSKYNPKNPYGIVLEEGDQVGVTVNDDLSTLVDHTIMAEGTHLGAVNAAWVSVLP